MRASGSLHKLLKLEKVRIFQEDEALFCAFFDEKTGLKRIFDK